MFSHSIVPDSFVTQWTAARQAPLSMGFPWQEYWNGLPFPCPGYLPKPEIKTASPSLVGRFFTTVLPGKPIDYVNYGQKRIFTSKQIPKYSNS